MDSYYSVSNEKMVAITWLDLEDSHITHTQRHDYEEICHLLQTSKRTSIQHFRLWK